MKSSKCVRIPLSGGFGNQLFQIIFSMFVRQELEIPVVVEGRLATKKPEHSQSSLTDIDWKVLDLEYSDYTPLRQRISGPLATVARLASEIVPGSSIGSKLSNGMFGHYYELSNESLLMAIQALPKPSRLVGYFQHRFYFEHLNETSKARLYWALANFANNKNVTIEPVKMAVHLRRGDYKNHPQLFVLDTSYYEKLIVGKKTPGSVVVFTDDRNDWQVCEFAKKIDAKISELKSATDVFFSLIEADSIVGANSSLSMSAAMLSRKSKENVFPSRWGSARYHDFAARGAYPSNFQISPA